MSVSSYYFILFGFGLNIYSYQVLFLSSIIRCRGMCAARGEIGWLGSIDGILAILQGENTCLYLSIEETWDEEEAMSLEAHLLCRSVGLVMVPQFVGG